MRPKLRATLEHSSKSTNNTEGGSERPSGRGNKINQQEYGAYIRTLVIENHKERTEEIYNKLLQIFSMNMLRMFEDISRLFDGSVDKKKVKSKISSKKNKVQKQCKKVFYSVRIE